MKVPDEFSVNIPKRSLEVPAVKRREALRAGSEPIIERTPIKRGDPLLLEEFLGKVGVPVVSDRSRVGQLKQVGGIDVDVPVQGGIDFPFMNEAGWASMFEVARNKQKNFMRAAEANPDKEVLGITSLMSPTAINFSTPVVEAMVGMVEAIDIPPQMIKHFDDSVNTVLAADGKPPFVGLQSPQAVDQLRGQNGFPSKTAGELRKLVVAVMASSGFRDVGFPIYQDVALAVTRPDLKRLDTGDSGLTVFKADPFAEVTKRPGKHNSYDTEIPGQAFGELADAMPPEIMFPKTMAGIQSELNKAGVPKTRDQALGALRVRGDLFEVFDEEWLAGAKAWEAIKGQKVGALPFLLFGALSAEVIGRQAADREAQ